MKVSPFLGKLVYVWVHFQISSGTFLTKTKCEYPSWVSYAEWRTPHNIILLSPWLKHLISRGLQLFKFCQWNDVIRILAKCKNNIIQVRMKIKFLFCFVHLRRYTSQLRYWMSIGTDPGIFNRGVYTYLRRKKYHLGTHTLKHPVSAKIRGDACLGHPHPPSTPGLSILTPLVMNKTQNLTFYSVNLIWYQVLHQHHVPLSHVWTVASVGLSTMAMLISVTVSMDLPAIAVRTHVSYRFCLSWCAFFKLTI